MSSIGVFTYQPNRPEAIIIIKWVEERLHNDLERDNAVVVGVVLMPSLVSHWVNS